MRAVSSSLKHLLAISCGIAAAAFAQSPLSQFTFGGSGTDSIHSVTTDTQGNIYVTGTTYSADLPVVHASQPINSGTQLVYSADGGATWKPLASPFNPGPATNYPLAIAADPTNPAIFYSAHASSFCKTPDSGQTLQCTNLPFVGALNSVTSLQVDPHTPSTIYLTTAAIGIIYKSTDGGQTWKPAGQGLPSTGSANLLTIDPFHPGTLFLWNGNAGFVSKDGASTWIPSTLPYPASINAGESFFGLFFDAGIPGVIYGPAFQGTPGSGNNIALQKSTDGGTTWTQLILPFSNFTSIAVDPKSAGVLYATTNGNSPALWKSSDGGATWTSTPAPAGIIGPLSFDPQNPQIILAGSYGPNSASRQATYRSTDGGITWTPVARRILQPVFANGSTVYATANPTSDAFLAKFLPDGKTLVFATYFGSEGNETGNAIALDPAGNIWIGGNTGSADLPGTAGSFQPTFSGQNTSGFVAKFTSDGQLIAGTYLGGSVLDTVTALAAGPQGTIWVGGRWTSPDFPFPARVAIPPSPASYLVEFDASLKSALAAMPLDGYLDNNGNAIAVDASGNVLVAGSTTDPNFPTTVQPLPGQSVGRFSRVFVEKLDPSGAPIYSTAFGGTLAAPLVGKGIGFTSAAGLENIGVAAAVDRDGNAYIAGYTDATNFPTTAGAYQTTLADACPYPAFENNTGLIGVFSTFFMDDSFVVKLSPDGSNALYSTLIGGQCYDHPISFAVDANGRAAIVGETDSFDYPQMAAIVAAPPYAQNSSFASVLNASGSGLDFSTYLAAGATPAVAASAAGFDIVGSAGPNAQSPVVTGAYTFPYNGPPSHGYLAVLNGSQSAPPVNLTQVLNAFSLQPGPVAPGEIVALTVPGFTTDQPVDVGLYPSGPLTTTLSGVSVLFDGKPAYLITVFPGRIVCIAPLGISGKTTTAIQVTTAAGASNTLNANVAPVALGLLTLDGSGSGAAYAQNQDGSLNSASNPAAVGSKVTVFFTGAGVTNPLESDGVPPTNLNITPTGGVSIYPYGGVITALPGFVPGIFAYTFTVPANSPAPFQVNTQVNFYQSQFLRVFIQ